ncbi:NAD(P)/FAD-dependent oxidoreductase [Sphingobium aromaticivastans]|uniref:flavin-containing monooxygenase n=1 Tax=Sphingobium aromaticivastans TaxID=1778665 RepID=UPI0030172E27
MKTEYDIIILGAGLGGLGLGVQLRAQSITDFLIVEKEQGPGGTWRDNIYPGAACDTESHLYCYSFELHKDVSRLYARQPELLRYAERLVDRHGLGPHIAYGQEITAARWDEQALRWVISLADGGEIRARVFVAAWGQLNRPQIPAVPGRERFSGTQFHSARWPAQMDFGHKRVASIGNAASAIQYIPEIAPLAGHLTVFQRSPNWIVPRGDRPYTDEELRLFTQDDTAFADNKAELFAWRETTFMRMREGSDEAREIEAQARDHLSTQVADPGLRAKLLPDFPLGCKRVLRSDDYYPTLCRDNVDLVTDPIDHIVEDGIVTRDGTLHSFDIIIWGTGFETQSFQGPVDVHGVADQSLRDAWSVGARAYKGMTVAGFPNFFLIYGPNTNLGHNSILSMFEAQFGYITQAVRIALMEGIALDVRRDVMDRYDAELQEEMNGSAWVGDCTSWYKNADGRVVNNWSGPVQAYRDLTKLFDRDAYRVMASTAA